MLLVWSWSTALIHYTQLYFNKCFFLSFFGSDTKRHWSHLSLWTRVFNFNKSAGEFAQKYCNWKSRGTSHFKKILSLLLVSFYRNDLPLRAPLSCRQSGQVHWRACSVHSVSYIKTVWVMKQRIGGCCWFVITPEGTEQQVGLNWGQTRCLSNDIPTTKTKKMRLCKQKI